jgi:hypothetical protein
MILQLSGDITIATLIQVLREVSSFCGEDSQVTLTNTPIALDIAHFVEDRQEQEGVFIDMMNALAKYPIRGKLQ